MLETRVESMEAIVGLLLGGFCPVHISDRLQSPEVMATVARFDLRALVYTEGLSSIIETVPGLGDPGGPLVIGIGKELVGGSLRFDELISSGSTTTPLVHRELHDIAFMGCTSGTTGTPKAVMHSERTLLRMFRYMPFHWGMVPRNRFATLGSLSFVSGIWGILLPHLYLGGQISFMTGADPEEFVRRMALEGTQLTSLPGPLMPAFIDAIRTEPNLLKALCGVLHSGSMVQPDTVRALIEVIGPRYIEAYGMTETGAPVTRTIPDDWTERTNADNIFASAGRPVHIADVTILDGDGSPLPVGQVGEVAVRSETLFEGYYGAPEQTAQVLIDGWLHTGDAGRLDQAGYLYITDRLKDMIVSGGMNVFAAEVEGALQKMPGIASAAVIGVPHPRWGETVVAAVVRSDDRVNEQAVIEWVRSQLASYKKPTAVKFVAELPLTGNYKVDKRKLRAGWDATPGTTARSG